MGFWCRKKKEATPLIDIMKGDPDVPKSTDCTVPENPWSQKQLVMEEGTAQLCRELSCSVKAFKCQEWIAKLDKYIGEHERLLYASITNYIFGLEDKAFTTFLTNLDAVIESEMSQTTTHGDRSEKRRRILIKFRDHVNLARMQFTLFSQRQDDIDQLIDRRLEPALAKSSKELTSQLVGLVAIFTALSFIVFGGISSLDSLFSSLTQNADSVLPVLITAIAWAFCILNLLFAFMYFVMRIIGMLPKEEKKGNLVRRYPLVFLSNYCLFAAFLICSGALFAKQAGIGRGLYDCVLKNGDATFLWGIVIIVVLLLLIGGFLLFFYLHRQEEPKSAAEQPQD